MSMLTYVYLVTNKITNQFYYGSRFKNVELNRSPENDFWIHYFTSSKSVKNLIKEYGKDSFEYKILFKDKDYDNTYWFEQNIIKENILNPLCLNKSFIDQKHSVKFSTAGTKASDETKKRLSIAKSNISEETRIKMSIAKKDKSTGPFTELRKKNISNSKKNKSLSEVHCRNISLSKMGENNPNFGKPRDNGTKKKMSEWQQAHREERAAESRARWQDPIYRKMMMDARKKK